MTYNISFLIGDLHQHHVTRMTFDQGRNVAVLRSCDEVAFPMTRDRPIFNRCRTLADRDDVLDLPLAFAFLADVFGSKVRTL